MKHTLLEPIHRIVIIALVGVFFVVCSTKEKINTTGSSDSTVVLAQAGGGSTSSSSGSASSAYLLEEDIRQGLSNSTKSNSPIFLGEEESKRTQNFPFGKWIKIKLTDKFGDDTDKLSFDAIPVLSDDESRNLLEEGIPYVSYVQITNECEGSNRIGGVFQTVIIRYTKYIFNETRNIYAEVIEIFGCYSNSPESILTTSKSTMLDKDDLYTWSRVGIPFFPYEKNKITIKDANDQLHVISSTETDMKKLINLLRQNGKYKAIHETGNTVRFNFNGGLPN